jgi:hypothetical protein
MVLSNIFVSGLKDQIRKVCQEEFLVCGEGEEQGGAWMEKVSHTMPILDWKNVNIPPV